MITASVLTKNLQIHSLQEAQWFWETLVDADLANNTLGWQWGAELARLPDRWIYQPWAAPEAVLQRAGVELDKTWPRPVVDLGEPRKRALQVYFQLR